MTLPPEKIGDKGQRFRVDYWPPEAGHDVRCLGYAPTREGAEQMADIWRKHPQKYIVSVTDREPKA